MKMLDYKETVQPEQRFREWRIGIDKRRVATYVGLALIGGFALGVLTARYIAASKPLARPEGPTLSGNRSEDPGTAGRAVSPPVLPSDYRRVARILRSDAIEVDTAGAVKMLGVDPGNGKSQQSGSSPFSQQALAFTQSLLLGKDVKLQLDAANSPTSNRNDAGEILAYVYTRDGTFANEEIVKQGYAFVSSEPFSRAEEFRAQERAAMEGLRGVWGPGNSAPASAAGPGAASSGAPGALGGKSVTDKPGEKPGDKMHKPGPLLPAEFDARLSAGPASAGEPLVFVSPADKMYHKDGCEYLNKKKQQLPLSQAKASGYVACGRCFASTVLKAQ
jgi:micrococcal nuclease